MNKIIYLLSIVFLVSCNDFLKEEPRSSISPAQFYQSDDEANAGAKGVYFKIAQLFGGGSGVQWDLNYWLHYGTDIARPTGGRESQYSFHIYTLSVATEGCAPDLWRTLYRGVADACNLIDNVSNSSKISEKVKKQIVAEGKLYRAFYYYYLTSLWGDVPFIEHFDTDYAISGLSRTNVSEIRNYIIKDLEECVDYLPISSSDSYKGRPTKWAGKVMLCKFYAWEKQWEKLSKLCEEIIQNSPHKLVDEYSNLWGLKNEYNSEFIWEFDFVQYVFSQQKTTQMFPRSTDEKTDDPELSRTFSGFGLLTATDEFIDSFDKSDKRRIWYKWLDGDSRVNFNYNYVAKFLDEPKDAVRYHSGINIPYFRLADVYLMQAEAENEVNNGPTQKAYERINMIRKRAGLSPLSGRNKDEFFIDIMNERKWELAFEYNRKLDLCRWNKLVDVVKTMSKSNPEGAKYVDVHHQLLPIPSKEIAKNPNLTQNPGY